MYLVLVYFMCARVRYMYYYYIIHKVTQAHRYQRRRSLQTLPVGPVECRDCVIPSFSVCVYASSCVRASVVHGSLVRLDLASNANGVLFAIISTSRRRRSRRHWNTFDNNISAYCEHGGWICVALLFSLQHSCGMRPKKISVYPQQCVGTIYLYIYLCICIVLKTHK